MRRLPAAAKINLALVVGPKRPDGLHELTTVLQRVDVADRIALEPSSRFEIDGFRDDTLVRRALTALAAAAGVEPAWKVRIEKRVPVGAGLGGGSSDAATALRLANDTLARPLDLAELSAVGASLGADVPFFLHSGPQLGEGTGTTLRPLALPQDYWVVLVEPGGEGKVGTRAVYEAFEARDGARGYGERRAALLAALERVRRPRDLAALPPNDLASSPIAGELLDMGAFRADVTGAGPVVYGLFQQRAEALAAQRGLGRHGRTWLTVPAWYF